MKKNKTTALGIRMTPLASSQPFPANNTAGEVTWSFSPADIVESYFPDGGGMILGALGATSGDSVNLNVYRLDPGKVHPLCIKIGTRLLTLNIVSPMVAE